MNTNRTFPRWSSKPARGGVLALALVATAAGCSRDRGDAILTTAGDLTLEVALRTDPPRQQNNVVDVTVKDREGRPVEGAEVEIVASMPAMAWVPGMRNRAGVEPRGEGRYRGELDLVMGGTWALDVAVRSGAGNGAASYSLTVGAKGLQATGASADRARDSAGAPAGPGADAPGDAPSLASAWTRPPVELPAPVVEELRGALDAYEEVRALLAADRREGLDQAAARLAGALRATGVAFGRPATDVGHCLGEGVAAAERLGDASDLETARAAFGEVSRFLIAIAAVDPRVTLGRHLVECPMTDTFNLWMQTSPEVENPYMGQAMPRCGVERTWRPGEAAQQGEAATEGERGGLGAHEHGSPAGGAAAGDEVAYFSCSMHTHVRSADPGTCPICSMDLVPVTEREVATGEIVVDPMRRQTIGVRTGKVERRPLRLEVRAAGKVAYDETRLAEVSVKYSGWIGRLHVNATGQPVRRGETLFTIYSPELYAAQGEYLSALESQRRARATTVPDRADYLVEASRQRLRLWDLRDADLDRIATSGRPIEHLPIASPVSGHVIEKNVVEGAAVEAGRALYRIAALDRVWVEADVYESDLRLVRVGQRASVTLPNLPGQALAGMVAFLYPYLDDAARTGRVRIELPNPGLVLKPAMYADVTMEIDRGEALQVPESAVLYTGPRRLVFLDLGEGRLRPQSIEVGADAGGWVEVLAGLEEGDVVVTSGTFLVAAESRLKSAAEQWQ
ncbi:MAG TPA: efflux RND transporter periplasmic adaptor subunit [Thermoanaerobaculia bacterium]|nr:efflux RND transporter periplasmic adaptor subunit [Thermoanaerobaculia bacterium]